MKVELKGFRELDRILSEDLPKATAKRILRKIAKAALEPMASRAASFAPDDPATSAPDLPTSITVSEVRTRRVKKERGKITGIQMAMGPASGGGVLNYATHQEFGTEKMPANPYMRPAWDGGKNAALDYVKDNLGDVIRKAAARHAKKTAKGR